MGAATCIAAIPWALFNPLKCVLALDGDGFHLIVGRGPVWKFKRVRLLSDTRPLIVLFAPLHSLEGLVPFGDAATNKAVGQVVSHNIMVAAVLGRDEVRALDPFPQCA